MKIIYFFLFLILLTLFFSCEGQKKNHDVTDIMNQLEKNNFYKEFMNYQIIPRDPGRVYVILNDSLGEFWVWYDEGDDLSLGGGDEVFDKKLKSLYQDEYLTTKQNILSKLNKLLNFMNNNGIIAAINIKQSTEFSTSDTTDLIRYYDKIEEKDLILFRKLKYKIEIINSKWIMVTKPAQEVIH